MTTKPFLNAGLAAGYIGLVVLAINFLAKSSPDTPGNLLIPTVMLSLFVLSAAVMSYLFFYQPFQLYFDGKRQEALRLFLNTVLIFACITAVLLSALFFVLYSV